MSSVATAASLGDVTLALHAALDDPTPAAEAWRSLRARIDLDHCWDHDILRVLPLIWRNLTRAGVDDPDMARLRGVHRRNWYLTQRAAESVGSLVGELERAGMRAAVVGGLSLVARAYEAGDRSVDDTHIVVGLHDMADAIRVTEAGGWRLRPERRRRVPSRFSPPYRFEIPAQGVVVVLCTSPAAWFIDDPSTTTPAHEQVTIGDHQLPAVTAAVELVVALLGGHGRRHGLTGARHGWVVDTVGLLRSGLVEPERLVATVQAHRLGAVVIPALGHLEAEFEASAGPDLIERLERLGGDVPAPEAALLARCDPTGEQSTRHDGRARRLRHDWLLATRSDPRLVAWRALPSFLSARADVDGPLHLPAELARRVFGVSR